MLDRLQSPEECLTWAATAILAISGLLFLWWGLWEDRSRGRRRCPACQYDMAGVPGLVCPECGRDAKKEKRLFKTRRRRAAVAVGVVLVLLAMAAPNAMWWYENGWRRTVPTWVVLQLANLQGWPPVLKAEDSKWTDELLRRYRAGDLGWGRSAAMRAMARHWAVEYRPKWPAGVPIHVQTADVRWWDTGTWRALRVRLAGQERTEDWVDLGVSQFRPKNQPVSWLHRPVVGALPLGAQRIDLEVSVAKPVGGTNVTATEFEPEWSGRISCPIQIVSSVDEVLTPTPSDEIGRSLMNGLSLTVQETEVGEAPSGSVELGPLASPPPQGMAVAARIEILRDGVRVAEVRVPIVDQSFAPWSGDLVFAPITDQPLTNSAVMLEHPADHLWQVRIRGDGELALYDFDATSYWSGDVVENLELIGHTTRSDGSRRVKFATLARRGR